VSGAGPKDERAFYCSTCGAKVENKRDSHCPYCGEGWYAPDPYDAARAKVSK
jgi:rubrerythrin